ncbi:hypothetical protein QBC33DRAFT_597671 [Phialemonium atrogriseum]|uniref:OTU domain-containing protein n=1 Tax=Phialemonium atrogriseum TaxID=1093897 RepID=A0AAJ0C9C7_9PEZI|nr:uncharacterized protein QBC33DRAFT_597671 [Phialemonium atrogriseum]KAK1771034.1 hypothetical protein QBC33DRAFT_597671 [Phialemonium atrogriseum]
MEETLEQLQSRHRKEQRDLQSRVTSKKKNATKKTRKGVNDECAELERLLKQRQRDELLLLRSLDDGESAPPDADAAAEDDKDEDEPDDAPADGIADALRSTTLTDPATPSRTEPSSPTSPTASQQAQPHKKRNRQKERLARRAAEAEAAAAAASAEAAGMEDRRGNEGAHMRGEFRRMGLSEREVLPDGHCLFSAVADQLGQVGVALSSSAAAAGAGAGAGEDGQKEQPYRVVRRAAAAYMEAHADDFAGFVEGEGLRSYVEKIRDTAEWGGQLELVALAGAYGVDIHVVQDGSTEVITPNGADGEGEGERKKIWLAYYRHGYGLGEHYNSLRKTAPAT